MVKNIIMNPTFVYMQVLGMKKEINEIVSNPNNKPKQISGGIQYILLNSGYRYVEI